MRRLTLPALLVFAASAAADDFTLRSRVQPFKGVPEWREVTFGRDIDPKKCAVVVCDMWDDHWCKAAARRCADLARKTEPALAAARRRGMTVVHAPSECMPFYADTPQRKRALGLPKVESPKPLDLPDPPLPIDCSDGGCDDETPARPYKAWTRQTPLLTIAPEDYVTDRGEEVYAILKHKGLTTLFVCGVHTNFCVLNRSFAIKRMTRWGVPCVLVRDLTDAMYDPRRAPFVSHDEGTELVVRHIEQHWCPTVTGDQLLGR